MFADQEALWHELFSLEGKVAIVTGAAGYFGSLFAETLLRAGAKVFLFGRSPSLFKRCQEMTSKYGEGRAAPCQVDCYQEDQFRAELMKLSLSSPVDILVNNAFEFSPETGFNHPSGAFEKMSKSQWLKSLESGVYWHALASQVIGEKMKQQQSGVMINVSSMYALVAPDPTLYEGTSILNPPAYSAAKAALLALTRYTASYLGPYHVRCNALLPGAFPNENPTAYNSPKNEAFMERLKQKTVLGRFGKVEDLSGPLLFLASNASGYMTGQPLVIDGGWTVR